MSRPASAWISSLLVCLLILPGLLSLVPAPVAAGAALPLSASGRAGPRGDSGELGGAGSGAPSSVPANAPALALALTAEPPQVTPSGAVTLTAAVANRSALPLTGIALTATLPFGLAYVPGSAAGLAYQPTTRQLTAVLPALAAGAAITGTFRGRPDGVAVGATLTTTLTALAVGLPEAITAAAEVTIVPEAADAAWVTPQEGGWLRSTDGRLDLAVPPGAVPARTRITYTPQAEVLRPPTHLHFAFRLEAQDEDGLPQPSFAQPATLILSYRADELLPTAGLPLVYYLDETEGEWLALSTQVDQAREQVRVAVSHPGLFAASSDEFVPEVMPTIRGIQADLFTGSASVAYDIPLPPGRGGLAPALALQFNSQSRQADPGHSSVLGTGWRLSTDSFIWWDRSEPGTPPATWRLDGVAYSERWGPGGRSDMYFQEAPQWRLREPEDAYAADGTRYHFEEALYDWWCNGTTLRARADKWALQYVVDPAGNRIDYVYDVDLLDGNLDSDLPVSAADVRDHKTFYQDALGKLWREKTLYCDGDETLPYLSQVNLRQIRYNGGQTVVEFSYATRDDAPLADPDTQAVWAYYTTRLLTEIRVRQAGSLVAGYKVTYDHWGTTPPGLPSTRRYAPNAIYRCRDEALTQCLPPWTFTNNMAYGNLSRVDNGYGGQVGFAYTWDVVAYTAALTTRTVTDMVTGRVDSWSYTYGSPIAGVGFQAATETLPASLGAGNTIYHHFLDGSGVDAGFRGKEDVQRVTVGGVTQQETTRVWAGTTAGVYGGGKLVYLSEERQLTYDRDGLNPLARKTAYFYDLDHQGNAQYGNLTRLKAYSDDGVTLYRTTERWFYPKNDVANGKYIVNRVGQEKLWDGSNVCQGQSRTVYDTTGFNQHQTPPTQGLPKEVWQAAVCDSASQSDWVRQTLNGYDSYGNLNSTTAANGAVTQTGYDAAFGAYPLSVTMTAGPGGGTTQTIAYAYYGLNAEPGGSGLVGQLQSTTDANNAVTRFSYDAFGRPAARRKPGAAFGHPPTEQYAYTDSIPFIVRHGLRDDANGDTSSAATYLEDWTFYDGLGQAIQTQAESTSAGQCRIVHSAYDALGRVSQQTMPAFYPAAAGVYRPPAGADWAGRTTYSSYDTLGRVTAVTGPDGATVRTFYNGRRTAVLDANNHQALQESDAFGRLVSSRQFEGVFSQAAWGATPYAWATYAYNVRDQLTDLWDTAGHRTAIGYDLLGRKTALSDPDMGAWSYVYDPAGNLVRQTDARGVTTWLGYDGFSRLTQQRLTDASGTLLAGYGYDETGHGAGVGRRTSMTAYTAGQLSSRASWVYDLRGRVTGETRTVAGVAYTAGYGYDSADRMLSLTYPDGETVATSYDGQGQPYALSSSLATYVASSTYDEAARLSQRVFGASGLQTAYTYYAWAAGPGYGGRLQNLASGIGSGGRTLQNLTHAYDPTGNLTRIRDDNNSSQRQCFLYDALARLTDAYIGDSNCAPVTVGQGAYSEHYAYDPLGNLTSRAGAAYSYGDPAHIHAVTHVGAAPRACYDAAGNPTVRLVGGQLHLLTYDAENRLVAVSGRASFSASAGRSGTSVALSWAAVSGATAYEVWRATTPYFTPGESGSVKVTTTATTSYTDPGRIGDPNTNYFYLIVATAGACPVGVSVRLGEFDFGLTPGGLLGVAGVRDVDAPRPLPTLPQATLADTPLAAFAYDADGRRVRATVGSVTTSYPFDHYEVEAGGVVRKYYALGGQRIAVRADGALSYLLADHLGSTSVSADANGARTGELRYLPFGELRTTWGLIPTERRFTGQPRYDTLGLDYFGARWYDSALGRFTQPDTLVPQPGDPQALNRYSYALNNPVKYRDPTGHSPQCAFMAGGGPLGAIAALICEVGYAVASYGPQLVQLASDLSQFAASPQGQLALQHAQQVDAAVKQATGDAGNGGNTASSGGLGPEDPWDKFSNLVEQGKSAIDAATEASTQGSGDRFVIGPYDAPLGISNYIKEAVTNGGKYFDAGTKLWNQLAQRGLAEKVNRQAIYEQMKAGISRIDISSGVTIKQILDNPKANPHLFLEVGWIQEFAQTFGYVENATGTGWVRL